MHTKFDEDWFGSGTEKLIVEIHRHTYTQLGDRISLI
jgi:hypothetical protein